VTELDTARLDMLRDLDPGSTAYLDRAILNFQVKSVAAVDAIRQHVLAGETAAMRAAAHRIAGSALNLGAAFAAATARKIETLGDVGTTDGALDLLPELEDAMERARELLLRYQGTYAAAE
jgi:HPt (histidine-containing phosphotransfer) domain-containing protein